MILTGNILGADILGNPMMSVLFCFSRHLLLQIIINFAAQLPKGGQLV